MFYEGTLQEGISNAVGQQKLVLCFVTGITIMTDNALALDEPLVQIANASTDENDESQLWENDFLTDESVS